MIASTDLLAKIDGVDRLSTQHNETKQASFLLVCDSRDSSRYYATFLFLITMLLRILVPAWLVATASVAAWSPPSPRTTRPAPLAEHAQAIGSALLVGVLATAVGPAACWADQIGVEKEAPTLPTGETVEVSECVCCVVGGPICWRSLSTTASGMVGGR
jgi:hypothetical protein